LFDLIDVFSHAGADKAVLEPAVGTFDFPFGLGREGISNFHLAIFQDLFPLRIGFIGEEVMLSPEGISALDEAKDGMGIHVVGVRQSVAKDHGLESLDMRPTGLFFDEDGVKEESTVIIQGSDEIPFFSGGGRPKMIGGVVLNEFSGVPG
jgi:hypothetical protein